MKKPAVTLIIIIFALASFGYGVIVGKFQYPPYNTLKELYFSLIYSRCEYYKAFSTPAQIDGQLSDIIRTQSSKEIAAKRYDIINYIWGGDNIPFNRLPDNIVKDMTISFSDKQVPMRVDKLAILLDYEIESYIYHIIPSKPNNTLIIYHQGNTSEFTSSPELCDTLLGNGYSVMLISMPFHSGNTKPLVNVPGIGRTRIDSDLKLSLLPMEEKSPLNIYVEPVTAAINYAETNYSYEDICMIGFSGGAFVTTVYSAIDWRIKKSYPVDGTIPLFIRIHDKYAAGAYIERSRRYFPGFYNLSNLLELYLLGSSGSARKQLQILNEYPLGCITADYIPLYEKQINLILDSSSGGLFKVHVNKGKEHEIDRKLLEFIIADILKSNRA